MRILHEGRTELKYALPVSRRTEVLALAEAHVTPGPDTVDLSHVLDLPDGPPPAGYRVHSMYVDGPHLEGYRRRLAEVDIRNRVRVRTYGDPERDGPVFLEAKRKLHEYVIKHRVAVGFRSDWARMDPVQPWVDAVASLRGHERIRLAQRWLDAVSKENMTPVCRTHYTREVYVAGSVRVTLDHHVRGGPGGDPRQLVPASTVDLIPNDWMVLELKFSDSMPGFIRRMLRSLRLGSEPVSKFALGVVRTVRQDTAAELAYLTPPSVRRAGIVLPAADDAAAAR